MAVGLTYLKYTQSDGTELELDDWESVSVRRTGKVKNNSADVTLKNKFKKMLSGRPVHRWIEDDGSLIFKTPRKIGDSSQQPLETIEIFAARRTSPEDIDTSDTSSDRIFTGYITEVEGDGQLKKSTIKLKLTDTNFIFLNNNGVGIYKNTYDSGTPTAVGTTTVTDSGASWTTNDFVGKILVFNKSGTEYRYVIKSNTGTVITLQDDDDVSGDGITTSDDYVISWTSGAIMRDQIRTTTSDRSFSTFDVNAYFDFENSDRKQVSAIGTHTLTLSGASYSVNELAGRYGHVTSGSAKGKRLSIRSNTSDTLTFYGDTDLTTLGITTSDYFRIAGATSGIETIRPDGSAYPAVVFSKAFKPLYEWFNELGEVENISTSEEINDGDIPLVCSIPLVYHINNKNVFFAFYPSDEPTLEIDTSVDVATGSDSERHRVFTRKVQNKVRDAMNFIIFRYKDFNGVELLDYVFDPTSGAPIVQDCYKPYLTISNDIIKEAYQESEIATQEYGATISVSYPMTAYPAWWSGKFGDGTETFPEDDDDYKDLFEKEALGRAKNRANNEINRSGGGTWTADLSLDFEVVDVNEPIKYTDWPLGVPTTSMRIKDVNYSLRKSQMRTSIKLEEDPDPFNKEV